MKYFKILIFLAFWSFASQISSLAVVIGVDLAGGDYYTGSEIGGTIFNYNDGGVDPNIPLDVQLAEAMEKFGIDSTDPKNIAKINEIAKTARSLGGDGVPALTEEMDLKYFTFLDLLYKTQDRLITNDEFFGILMSDDALMKHASDHVMSNSISNSIALGSLGLPAIPKIFSKFKTPKVRTKVTSWAEKGINPDLKPGRWIVKGEATKFNFFKTGLWGPKFTNKPPFF